MSANVSAPAAPVQIPPGALFGVPGYTQYTEQRDNNDGMNMVLAQSNAVDMVGAGAANYKDTDVVFWWDHDFAWTNTITPGTSAITTSPYFPFNLIQSMVLSVQNAYKPLEVLSGIDAAIFQMLRPMRQNEFRNNLNANPALNWQTANIAQANLITGTGFASTSTAINWSMEVPTATYFDAYYHLDKAGNPVAGVMQPQRCWVSPLYMAGSARWVQPQFRFAPLTVSNLDTGPFNIGAGTGTGAGSVKQAIRRSGVYASPNPAVLPQVMVPWQTRRKSTQYSIAGRSFVDIPISAVADPGQILSLFVRMWDPAANGGLGAPISISNVTIFRLTYGSGLFRFDDTPLQAQKRIFNQHGILLPQGVLAWDLATDTFGRTVNQFALNTLTTAGVNIRIEFSAAQSTSAYVVVGTEELVIVE